MTADILGVPRTYATDRVKQRGRALGEGLRTLLDSDAMDRLHQYVADHPSWRPTSWDELIDAIEPPQAFRQHVARLLPEPPAFFASVLESMIGQ